MRKWVPAFWFACAFGVIAFSSTAGCGGGGGGGGSSSNGGGGAMALSPSSVTVGPNGQVFVVARSNGANIDVSWNATSGFVTPISAGFGLYAAPASGTATLTATTIALPTRTDTMSVTVNPAMATVRGRVVSDNGGFGVSGVILEFRNGSTLLNTITTGPNGYFSTGVLPTATRVHIRNSSVPAGFYKSYNYNSKRYTTIDTTCSAVLPALSVGASVELPTSFTLNSTANPPPPPPNGCS